MAKHYVVEESWLTHLLFNSTKSSWFWLVVRLYVGWQWLEAGLEKLGSPAWVGPDAGKALSGFVQGALGKASGAHPDVQGWYAAFLQSTVLSHPAFWSHLVAWGEAFVGVALIIGFLTGIASFFSPPRSLPITMKKRPHGRFFIMSPRQESNLHSRLRSPEFYPLNYEGRWATSQISDIREDIRKVF